MLENLTPPQRITPCRVREILSSLDKKDQDILVAALADPNWGDKTLARALSERGIKISDTPIRNHRSKGCSCAR